MKSRILKTGSLLIVFVCLGLITEAGYAQTVDTAKAEQFYRGKTMTWVVSAEPGGSTDVMTRILAPYLTRETGTRIAVKNMTGGSMEGDNWVFREAKRDGLTMLSEGTMPMLLNDLLKSPGVQYETNKFIFLTGVDDELCVFAISPKTPHKTLDALRKAKGLKVGASSARGYIAMSGVVAIELLGLDAKVVTGYQGMKSVLLAVAQGEMDMVCSSEPDISRAQKDGSVATLFVMGDERSPLFPGIPTIRELGIPIPKEMIDPYKTIGSNSRAIVFPPGVPEDRVLYLRKVFRKLNEMPEVQRDIGRWVGVWRPFLPGDKMQEEMNRLMGNQSLASQLLALLKKHAATK
jgi:tripartite-type tricarboxylate transporter receptor subunit TctC